MTLKSFTFRNLLSLTALATLLWTVPPAAAQQQEKVWVTHQAARLVVGQTSFTRQNPTPSQISLGAVGGVAVAGNRLFVADGNRVGAVPVSNRVLIYENSSSFMPVPEATLPQDGECPACVGKADVVLGQPNFTTIDPAAGSGHARAFRHLQQRSGARGGGYEQQSCLALAQHSHVQLRPGQRDPGAA